MNKRVFFAWLIALPPILLVTYLLFQNYIENIIIKNIYFIIMSIFYLLFPYCILMVAPFLCSPKSKLPDKISMLSFKNDIICEQIDRNNFIVHLYNKELKIDMTGWIFKKTYVRDIILMYYHLNYYNKNKFISYKCLSKKYFPGQNLSIIFMKKNCKNELYLIKNGKEKRSFLCSFKIFVLCGPALIRSFREPKDKYYRNDANILL